MLKKIAIFLIIFYRKYISLLKIQSCRFYPSCSEYALETIQKRGLVIGLLKTLWRVLRCNPFSKGGWDPPI
ncbi:MAG: membrane protein insertion efficiency factor YidD [Candidatus Omnitrophica bacterium 4484_213]|nr:MAG: membrane protein insertion efficiency factor YidD [Candidatus Omnitrophica bacterium 4484_213]